jgi:chromosome segregation ATPase
MSASHSVQVSRLEQAAIHNNLLFENIKKKRDALLAKKQKQLLHGSLQAVRNLSSLLNLLAGLKRGPPHPWSEQQAKVDKRCSNVLASWNRLDAAFNSTLKEYDELAQELKTLYNDVFLKDRERTSQLKDQIALELGIVRDRVNSAQGHIDALEHRLVALTDEMDTLRERHDVKVDSAAAAIKVRDRVKSSRHFDILISEQSGWICMGAGIGCWLLEPVFPPAGIVGWALMTGSYESSATSLVFSSKA